ncbi:hypothetical protein BZG36_03133 [Bifiguratus adelaidae]|uniref:Uncharacterized protein n=1 Tax=Bifiguratus adelaidae TaxID=1938954 RepID=A0A261XX96_9FUNG|nr:hypothetical protein BZG36_03133 [Bifiguratus adelaidae]
MVTTRKRNLKEGEETRKARKVEDKDEQASNEEAQVTDETKESLNGKAKEETSKETKETTSGLKDDRIIETGHIYFFYRPKVGVDKPEDPDDVQRLYMILKPDGGKSKSRLIIITRKKLPEIGQHAKYWAFVKKAANDVGELRDELKEEKYETKTKGTRVNQAARPLGEGVYAIVNHHNHSHIAYILTIPSEPSEIQESFNIGKEGSFVLSVKNPETANPPYAGLSPNQKAEFPQELQEKFRGRRFISLDPPDFLDYDYCEMLLIGASGDVVGELGKAGETLENMEEKDEVNVTKLGEEDAIFKQLKLHKEEHPVEPLHGEWS